MKSLFLSSPANTIPHVDSVGVMLLRLELDQPLRVHAVAGELKPVVDRRSAISFIS